jgi:hypothetical protein
MSSTYQIPNINNKPPQLGDLGWGGDIRFDPHDGTPDFIGINVACGASTANTDWKVYKFFYASAASTTVAEIRLGYGSWGGRAAITGF